MKKLAGLKAQVSVKNIFSVLVSIGTGYFLGSVIGTILGVILWALLGLVLGDFIYGSTNAVGINSLLSMTLGIFLSVLIIPILDRLFGVRMSYRVWGAIGIVLGLTVMFTYGTNIISHPEIYARYNHIILSPGVVNTDLSLKLEPLSRNSNIYFGGGTGQLIGSSLYTLVGLVISVHEIIAKMPKPEDKKEFDAYSEFFKNYSKR